MFSFLDVYPPVTKAEVLEKTQAVYKKNSVSKTSLIDTALATYWKIPLVVRVGCVQKVSKGVFLI